MWKNYQLAQGCKTGTGFLKKSLGWNLEYTLTAWYCWAGWRCLIISRPWRYGWFVSESFCACCCGFPKPNYTRRDSLEKQRNLHGCFKYPYTSIAVDIWRLVQPWCSKYGCKLTAVWSYLLYVPLNSAVKTRWEKVYSATLARGNLINRYAIAVFLNNWIFLWS